MNAPGRTSTLNGSEMLARLTPLNRRLRTQAGSAGLLLAATITALLWVNSPWGDSYHTFWHSEFAVRVGSAELALELQHWVNDGLMAFFFFVVGLEVKHELILGELTDRRRAALPALAALAGLIIPALVYLAFNFGDEAASAWGVVISTDTAFLLGVLALLGRAAPPQLRVFLLVLAIADDVGALSVIALFYTDNLRVGMLSLSLLSVALMFGLRWLRIWRGPAYLVLAVAAWVAMYQSGVHPTLLGVIIAFSTEVYLPRQEEVVDAARQTRAYLQSPSPDYAFTAQLSIQRSVPADERMQRMWQPWTNLVIVPMFALANAGVPLTAETLREAATSPITLGVIAGLVLGKLGGILVGASLAVRLGLGELAPGLSGLPLAGGAALSGIGFTISLFIIELAFTNDVLADQARVGVLAASILATLLGSTLLVAANRRRPVDDRGDLLDPPVDPARDHIRGPVDAPLILVEYGDFECPFCSQATGAIEDLRGRFGDRLAYVFRHSPLTDVHPHAELAAEASEAAAMQGRFWEMHDRLFAANNRLTEIDLLAHAAELGLDVPRFARDLGSGRFSPRVQQDVASAEASGVTGTPTFFIGGHRHTGPYDAGTLAAALLAEAGEEDLPDETEDPALLAPPYVSWFPRVDEQFDRTAPPPTIDPNTPETPNQDGAFPRLTNVHIAILERFGSIRHVTPGEILYRAGDPFYDFSVVLSGAIAVLKYVNHPARPTISVHGEGRFLGELDLFDNRPVSRTAMAIRNGDVLEVPRGRLREALNADAGLRDLVLRTFLVRRAMLLALATDLRIVDWPGSPNARRLQEYASARGRTAGIVDLEDGDERARFLNELGVSDHALPVVVSREGWILQNPTEAELDDALKPRA